MRRPGSIHDQVKDAGGPTGRVPLRFDREKTIAAEQRWRDQDLAATDPAVLTQPREVGFKPRQAKTVQREPLSAGLEPRTSPERHYTAPSASIGGALESLLPRN